VIKVTWVAMVVGFQTPGNISNIKVLSLIHAIHTPHLEVLPPNAEQHAQMEVLSQNINARKEPLFNQQALLKSKQFFQLVDLLKPDLMYMLTL